MAEVIPDYITHLDADSVTVRLGRPTTINGQRVERVTLRAPLVSDMRAAQRQADSPEEVESILFATLAGMPGAQFYEHMRWSDWERLQRGYFCMLAAVDMPAGWHANAHAAAEHRPAAPDAAPAGVADT